MAIEPSTPPKKKFSPDSSLGFAMRIGTEFTSGILVGLLMGYALDQVLNTKPWGLVVMVLLGAAAGILNIFRLLGLWGPSTNQNTTSSGSKKKDG